MHKIPEALSEITVRIVKRGNLKVSIHLNHAEQNMTIRKLLKNRQKWTDEKGQEKTNKLVINDDKKIIKAILCFIKQD